MFSRSTTTEIRIQIPDINGFRKKLHALKAKKLFTYYFNDFIFVPKTKKFDLNKESMKLRIVKLNGKKSFKLIYQLVKWSKGIKVLQNGFKIDLKSLSQGFELLSHWQFKKLFSFTRKGEKYSLKDWTFVLEKIQGLGWLIEIDGSIKKIRLTQEVLGLKKTVNKSIPWLVEHSK